MLDQTTNLASLLKDPSLLETRAYVNGEWIDGDDGTFAVDNPARGDTIAEVADLSRAQVAKAIAAAETEFDRFIIPPLIDAHVHIESSMLVPSEFARLAAVPLCARWPMQGSVSGRHPSPHRGASVEFAEYREYVPGDDLRRMDWRAYGRSDRFYVKECE